MSRRGNSSVSVVAAVLLMVLLPALHLPTAGARHIAVVDPNDGLNSRANEDIGKAWTDDLPAIGATTTTSASSRPRTVEMPVAARHGDAAAEMYNMLRRDYAWKASRRRPINNGATPLQVTKKP